MIKPKVFYILYLISLNAKTFPYKPIGGVLKNKEDEKMKLETKKILLSILVISLMLFSGLAVMAGTASASNAQKLGAATGTVTYSPTVFVAGVPTVVVANGGSFGSGSTVYFYFSTTTSASGIQGSYVGKYTLQGGQTSLQNAHVTITIPSGTTPKGYYLIASDSSDPTASGAQFTAAAPITVSGLAPTLTLSTSGQPTTAARISGNGFDAGATVTLYLLGPDGTPLHYRTLTSFTTTASGTVPQYTSFVIPDLSEGTYTIVAQETSSSSDNYGITVDTTLAVSPIITVSPPDTSGAAGSTLTIVGHGFKAGAVIPASTQSSPQNSIVAGGVVTYHLQKVIQSNGYFTLTVTLAGDITTTGPQYVTVVYGTESYTEPQAFYVSYPDPTQLGFSFQVVPTAGHIYPGNPVTAGVYDFPANTQVSIYFGPILLGKVTTNSNGFGSLSSQIPAMPAGTYTPVATVSSMGLYKSSSAVTVDAYYLVEDPVGTLMTHDNGEYFPSDGVYTVVAYGLDPNDYYILSDDGASSWGGVVSVSVGSYSSYYDDFSPASNGTLIFTYTPVYLTSTTGTWEAVTLEYESTSAPVPGYAVYSFGYNTIGTPDINAPSELSILQAGGLSESFQVSNLIPMGALTYPGVSSAYNVYLGNTKLSFVPSVTPGSSSSTFTTDSTGKITEISSTTHFTVSGDDYTVTADGTVGITGSANGVIVGHLQEGTTNIGTYTLDYFITSYDTSTGDIQYYMIGTFSGTNSAGEPISGTVEIGSASAPISGTLTVGGSSTIDESGQISVGLTSGATTTIYGPSADLVFNVPNLPSGVYNLTLVYAGNPVSNGVYSQRVVVSTPSTSLNAGTLKLFPYYSSSGYQTGYNVVGYGLYGAASSVNLYYMTYTGLQGPYPESLTYGAFVDTSALANVLTNNMPSGVYSVFAVVKDTSGNSYTIYTSYSIGSYIDLSATHGYVGDSITMDVYGLQPNQWYDYYFGNIYMDSFQTDSTGTKTGISFQVPVVPAGVYTISITPFDGSTVVASENFEVYHNGYLGLSTHSQYAFPGQLVQFSVKVGSITAPTIGSGQTKNLLSVYANVYLNGMPYVKVPAVYKSGWLMGSFQMPNDQPGSYYLLTIEGVPEYQIVTQTGGYYNYSFAYGSFQYSQSDFLGLVSGNGAYVMGISDSQIAEIVASVSDAVHTSMQVPLEQLNASVEAINNAVAEINTAFGKMYATLDAINATVTQINDGIVTLQTDMGTVKTAITNLNATIAGINGNVVELKTAVGNIQTTLDQLNATLVSMNGDIMNIKTVVGNIQTTVNSINAKIDSISGDVATIKTDVGTIKASLSSIDAKISSLQGDVATIKTDVGTINVKLDAINATVVSNTKGISDLKGSVVEIQTTLGNIKGTVTDIQGDVATIKTDLGTVKTDVSNIKTDVGSIKTNTENTANNVNTTLYWEIGVLVLIIITLILVAFVIIKVNKIPQAPKEEVVEETEEETKEE